MFKLMNKKLAGKKGFTLAELLVVIAILAILIAIAVPVFTHMVAEANLRVNQANVHSVRSAAVAHILTNLGMPDDSGSSPEVLLNAYINHTNAGWLATAEVDNNGNISNLKVYAIDANISTYKEGIGIPDDGLGEHDYFGPTAGSSQKFFAISDKLSEDFATVKPSMSEHENANGDKVYFVQAVVTDLDKDK